MGRGLINRCGNPGAGFRSSARCWHAVLGQGSPGTSASNVPACPSALSLCPGKQPGGLKPLRHLPSVV